MEMHDKAKTQGEGWDKADENVVSPMTLGYISDVSTWSIL